MACDQAEDPRSPQERFDNLTEAVDRLEDAFAEEFTNWGQMNQPNPETYFWATYSDIILALEHISTEKYKKDAVPGLQALFDRAVGLLRISLEYAQKADVRLRPRHKSLLEAVTRLGKRADITASNDLGLHVGRMNRFLRHIRPPPREAWTEDGTDLKPDNEFNRIYEEFCSSDEKPHKGPEDHEYYILYSYRLLQSACVALHIPPVHALIPKGFFENDTRPTWVDYSCRSKEFLYGQGNRPGILSLKSRLGGPLTAKQERNLNRASKKRRAGELSNSSKKPRTRWGYTMTSVNAAADIEDVLRDSKFAKSAGADEARLNTEKLVTPTCENRVRILAAYGDDLRYIIDEIYKKKFKTPMHNAKLPQTPGERKAWLQHATEEMDPARAMIRKLIDAASSPARAKQLRLEAFRLKLARALYTLGLFSGKPPASADEVKDGLQARLDDWILYEEAWNAGDGHILLRSGLTMETFTKVRKNIEQRDANIKRWREIRNELDIQGLPPGHVSDSESGSESDSDDNDNDDNNAKGDGADENDKEVYPAVSPPTGLTLTDEEVKQAQVMLGSILSLRKPDRGDYLLDWRTERKRRKWYQDRAYAELTGQPIPDWPIKKFSSPFAAGGPPDHEQLPRETVWDRLQYMWVMTSWRCYQSREMQY
ncbi:hypothetical protein F5Y19DRAFT_324264 [Xylariaceae sp. FL1651]|nr:hypothetical protein F5Y19DRAFT_324264 [Xylariaceae sp. FL1651]